ncbi:MAG TPA: hypothetical protein VF755_10950 [Catenuloplanes sp.]
MEVDSSSVRAVLYLEAADLPAVRVWHDAAEAALLPMVQPPGASAVDREVTGFTRAPDGSGGPMTPGVWADGLVPDLDQLQTIWSYGDDRPRGPIKLAYLMVFRPGPDEFLWLDLLADLAEPAVLPTVADAMIGVLRAVGDVADPVYGEILVNRYPHSPSTALDRLLRRIPKDSLSEGRRFLRGYEWVTVCPAEIAEALGGAGAMRASGAFAEVIELGTGGLLLRATDDPAGWTEEAACRVFDAVRPVLPPGEPRPLQFETITNVVMTDARPS